MNTKYISFCGTFNVPDIPQLDIAYPLIYQEVYLGTDSHGEERYDGVSTGFREGLSYDNIGGADSLTVYLAWIDGSVGHLVADCPAGGWCEETFVFIDGDGNPIKAEDNVNLNPIEQVV